MAHSRRSLSAVPTALLNSHIGYKLTALVAILMLAAFAIAQQASEKQPSSSPSSSAQSVTIPPGTRLALVLTHPVDSKSTHRGDQIYAETTAPVTVDDRVVLPAGTFVQGDVESLRRSGTRGQFSMRSLSLVLPGGYVSKLSGPTHLETDEGTAWLNPGSGTKVGAIAAPFAGAGLGLAIGAAAHTTETIPWGTGTLTQSTPKGMAIGALVGSAAGGITSIILLARSHQFYVATGSPMEMTLSAPVVLPAAQVAEAVRKAPSQAPVVILGPPVAPYPGPGPFPVDHGTCYTPEIPGTPPTVIPGIPATPNSPGTPDVVIPGTPATPGTPYPCP